jgi:hypothetical protein
MQLSIKVSKQENSRPLPMTKEAYRRPKLFQYGTLREITLATGFSGNPDGHANCGIGSTDKLCKTAL